MNTTFMRDSQQNLGVKNVQNSAQFLTTFEFDREYRRTGSTRGKLNKQYPSDVDVRNWIGELWSTNKEVIVVQVYQPKWTVFGILHFDRL